MCWQRFIFLNVTFERDDWVKWAVYNHLASCCNRERLRFFPFDSKQTKKKKLIKEWGQQVICGSCASIPNGLRRDGSTLIQGALSFFVIGWRAAAPRNTHVQPPSIIPFFPRVFGFVLSSLIWLMISSRQRRRHCYIKCGSVSKVQVVHLSFQINLVRATFLFLFNESWTHEWPTEFMRTTQREKMSHRFFYFLLSFSLFIFTASTCKNTFKRLFPFPPLQCCRRSRCLWKEKKREKYLDQIR